MEPGPMSSGMKIRPRLLVYSVLYVGIVGIVFYLINVYIGSVTAFAVVFLILLNTYWIYRSQIRKKLSSAYQKTNNHQQNEVIEKNGHQVLQNLKDEYPTCPQCDASIIPGLDYCEECGTQIEG